MKSAKKRYRTVHSLYSVTKTSYEKAVRSSVRSFRLHYAVACFIVFERLREKKRAGNYDGMVALMSVMYSHGRIRLFFDDVRRLCARNARINVCK